MKHKEQPNTTAQKALEINLDDNKYGTIVEIGAGQEVAREFFRAGGAAGTVAKTMSAYDMQFSDAIYGPEESGRYVTRSRVIKMLEIEQALLIDRLVETRSKGCTFFSYAATVAAKSYGRKNECHAWIGVRLQLYPGAEPSEIVMHVRMLDDEAQEQQEALGVIGVNLLYGAYYYFQNPKKIIESLSDNLRQDCIEVDSIEFSGPYFEEVENRLMNLHLIRSWLTRAVMFTPEGNVAIPADLLYKKNVLAIRGSFKPVTCLNVDMIEQGCEHFLEDAGVSADRTIVLAEITMATLVQGNKFDDAEFLARVDMLTGLGYSVMISDYFRYFRLRAYFRRYTSKHIGIVLGISNVREIFKESFYDGMEGGIMEGLGKLFPDRTRLYVYPEKNHDTGELITAENMEVDNNLAHLYRHLLENNFLAGIKPSDEKLFTIYSRKILSQLREGRGEWEKDVPPSVAEQIIERRLLHYNTE